VLTRGGKNTRSTSTCQVFRLQGKITLTPKGKKATRHQNKRFQIHRKKTEATIGGSGKGKGQQILPDQGGAGSGWCHELGKRKGGALREKMINSSLCAKKGQTVFLKPKGPGVHLSARRLR